MNLIDSSCWISYFTEHSIAVKVEKYVHKMDLVLIPTVVIYEVYRQLSRKIPDKESIFFITQLQKGLVVSLDQDLALKAAELSLNHKLGMADAIIYATALLYDAKVITLDSDFRGLPDCVVID